MLYYEQLWYFESCIEKHWSNLEYEKKYTEVSDLPTLYSDNRFEVRNNESNVECEASHERNTESGSG